MARIERLERMVEMPAIRPCSSCGKALQGAKKALALYCSATCRQTAYQKRKAGNAGPYRTCALEGCDGLFPLTDSRRIYCGEKCKSRALWLRRKRRAMRDLLGVRPDPTREVREALDGPPIA